MATARPTTCVVAAWVRQQRPDAQLWLAGFSFGAYVTLKVAATLRPGMLISIAPPAGRGWDFGAITPPECPWLVIQGEADEIVDPQAVYDWIDGLKQLRQSPELVKMPDTSHFFHRRLMDLRGAIKNGSDRTSPCPQRPLAPDAAPRPPMTGRPWRRVDPYAAGVARGDEA
jgi:alpha/beta superfamily hydrolase